MPEQTSELVLTEDEIKAGAQALYACGVTVPRGVSYADVVRDVAAALHEVERVANEPCDEEIHSWDRYRPEQIDSYWIRCTRVGPHQQHKDSNTGLTWGGDDA